MMIKLSYALEISEIMYNPEGSDNHYEYIELHSDQQSNLSNYYFEGIDLTFDDTDFEGYFVICKDKEKFSERYNVSCEEEYSGSLLNSGETITLYNYLGEIVDEVTYTDVAPEGKSISKEVAWQPSSATPHQPMLGNTDDSNITVVNKTFENVSVENVTVINMTEENVTVHNLTVENGTINVTVEVNVSTNVSVNLSINATNHANSTNVTIGVNETDIILKIDTNKDTYENSEKISIYFSLNEENSNFTIEYRIEDLFGNIVKKKWNTTNLNTKHYTPKIEEKDKVLVIKGFLYLNEFDVNTSNNYFEKKVFVRNEEYEEKKVEVKSVQKSSGSSGGSSAVKVTPAKKEPQIKSFYTRTKLFEEGKEITLTGRVDEGVEAFVVNGNDSVSLSVVDGEFSYKTNLSSKHPGYLLEIYRDGKKVEEKRLEFNITTTEEETKPLLAENLGEQITESVINQKKSQMTEPHRIELYESDNEGKKKIVNYIILGLSVLFNVILIWKR